MCRLNQQASFDCFVNIYSKDVLFLALKSSSSRRGRFDLLFTFEKGGGGGGGGERELAHDVFNTFATHSGLVLVVIDAD